SGAGSDLLDGGVDVGHGHRPYFPPSHRIGHRQLRCAVTHMRQIGTREAFGAVRDRLEVDARDRTVPQVEPGDPGPGLGVGQAYEDHTAEPPPAPNGRADVPLRVWGTEH